MALIIEYRQVADLARYERNARTHSPAQVAQIVASIREFGWTNPILVDEAGVVIAGHGRLAAALSLGMEEVPSIVLAGLSDVQKRALRIADNQLAINAGWDLELLASEVVALSQDVDVDLSLLGFDDEYIAGLLKPTQGDGDADDDDGAEQIDRAEELQRKWRTAENQLWLIPSKTAPPERQVTCPHCGTQQKAR